MYKKRHREICDFSKIMFENIFCTGKEIKKSAIFKFCTGKEIKKSAIFLVKSRFLQITFLRKIMLLGAVGPPKLKIWQMGPPSSELIEFQK